MVIPIKDDINIGLLSGTLLKKYQQHQLESVLIRAFTPLEVYLYGKISFSLWPHGGRKNSVFSIVG